MDLVTSLLLVVRAIAMLGATHLVLWVLARGLGLRLDRRAVLLGLATVGLFLAPYWTTGGSDRLVPAPLGLLGHLPTAQAPETSPHDVLNDVVYQLLPWESEVRRALGDGRLPLWSDSLDGGSSPWANPQAGVLSPIAWLARLLPLSYFLLAALAVKMLVAFHGTWLLARVSGTGRGAAAVAALGFSLGGGIVAWCLFPSSSAAAWAPWLVVATLRLLRPDRSRSLRRRQIATTALIAAAILLSGYVQIAIPTAALAGLVGLALGRRAQFRRSLPAVAIAAGLGVALAAPHLLPFLDTASQSLRVQIAETREPPELAFWWLEPERRAVLSVPLHPHRYGRPYLDALQLPADWPAVASGYSGLVALLGAAFAVVSRRRRATIWWATAAGGFLLVASWTPLAFVVSRLPLVSASDSSRYLPIVALALCVAAAHGVERWLRSPHRARVIVVGTLATASFLAGGRALDPSLAIWGALALLTLARPPRRILIAALLLLTATDLVPWGRLQLPRSPASRLEVSGPLLDTLRAEIPSDGMWRATARDHLSFPSLLPWFGVAELRPHNPLADADQMRVLGHALGYDAMTEGYFPPLRHPEHPLLDFLGVRLLVNRADRPIPPGFDRLTVTDGPWRLDRNAEAVPRYFLAREIVAIDNLPAWLDAMTDPRRVGVPRDELATAGDLEPSPIDDVVQRLSGRPGRVVLGLPERSIPRLLVTSWPHRRGWTATALDGELRLARLTVNGAFAGFVVPAGVDRVELRFVPAGFAVGWLLALLAAGGVVWLVASTPQEERGDQPER